MSNNLFPVRLPYYGDDYFNGYRVINDFLVEDVWRINKPKNITWYALNGRITENFFEIDVYTIKGLLGGVGEKVYEFVMPLVALSKEHQTRVKEKILEKQLYLAGLEYDKRKKLEEEKAIENIRKEMFDK